MDDLPEIKNHTVKELIAQGRTGPIYKGVQDSLQRDVAIKIISPKLLAHQKVVDEFLTRSRNAASVSHPNIVSIYNVDQDSDKLIYYTMEFMPGGSLADRIANDGNLPVSEAAQLTLNVARALEFGNLKDQVHGNLKPSKILYMDDGETFKLAGVGLLLGVVAKHSARNPTPFTAPEVIQTERPADHRADIFALGGLFYAMVAGEEFFESDEDLWKASSSGLRIVRPTEIVQGLPAEVDDLIMKMMAFDPDDRYQEYGEFFDKLEDLAEQALEAEAKATKKKKKKKAKSVAAKPEEEEEAGADADAAEEEEEPADEGKTPRKKKKKTPAKKEEPPEKEEEEEEEDKAPAGAANDRLRRSAPPGRRRPPGPRESKLPVGSIVMAVWSAILLGVVLKFLVFNKKGPDKNGDTPKGENQTTLSKTTVRRTSTIPKDIAPVLDPLANPEERVNELVELVTEDMDPEDFQRSLKIADDSRRTFSQARRQFSDKFAEGAYLEALAALASLHDNHAETHEEKLSARRYLYQASKKIDSMFRRRARPIFEKVQANQLAEAKAAFKALGEEFRAERWKRMAQDRIRQVDEVVEIRSGRPAKQKTLTAARAFDEALRKAQARVEAFVGNLDFAKAKEACQGILAGAPTETTRKLLEARCLEYGLQAHLVEQARKALNEKASELKIPLSYGPVRGVIKAVTKDGFTIQAGAAEAGVHYSKVKPKTLYGIYRRLSLDTDSLLGLAIFCYNQDLAQEGDQLIENVGEATAEQKAKIDQYLEGREEIRAAGSIEDSFRAYLANLEAEDLYERAMMSIGGGQIAQALASLQTIIDNYGDTAFLKKAKDLIAQHQAGEAEEEDPDAELADPEEKPERGGTDLEEETDPTAGGDGGARQADLLYQKARGLYTRFTPGMPGWEKQHEQALKFVEKAIQNYATALKEDPENPVLEDKMSDANRLRYSLMKTRPVKRNP